MKQAEFHPKRVGRRKSSRPDGSREFSAPSDPDRNKECHGVIEAEPAGSYCGARSPGRPLTMQEDERRERILDAACAVLRGHGYVGASMDKVANACGMSKRTLYHVFPSKHELIHEVIATRFFFVQAPLDPNTGTAKERLTALLVCLASHLLRPDRVSLARAIIADAQESEEIQDIIAQLKFEGERDPIDDELRACVAELGLVCDISRARRILFGVTIGELLLHQFCMPGHPDEWSEVKLRVETGVEIFLAGLKAVDWKALPPSACVA
ncbi:TetR/AcrR family transcriptional regulator [Acetobacter nitrogenifigens]|nr:TetR/AcrR family transcriptional regulator [Acetobacter nitrogenifigens]